MGIYDQQSLLKHAGKTIFWEILYGEILGFMPIGSAPEIPLFFSQDM